MSILVLTSDTLIGTPATGNIEYSSPIFTGTPIGTQRGIVPTQQYYRLDSSLAGANSTSAQNIFGVGVTLSASTVYEFEIFAIFTKSAGTTSHNFQFNFGGTATINNIGYSVITAYNSGTIPAQITSTLFGLVSNATTATTAINNITGAAVFHADTIKGTVSVNAGGTFIPQYTLSAAPGGAYSTVAGSYIRIAPVGASGSNTSVGAWA